MLYKEWCNYLDDDCVKTVFTRAEIGEKMRELYFDFEKVWPRPLLYLSGVMRIQICYYIIRERLSKGEQIYFFPSTQPKSTYSNSSLCSDMGNLLRHLSKSKIDATHCHSPADRLRKFTSFVKANNSKPLLCTRKVTEPATVTFQNHILKENLTPPRVFAPVLKRQPPHRDVKRLEKNLFQLCNLLPKVKNSEISSISFVLDPNSFARLDASQHEDGPPLQSCFKKKPPAKKTVPRNDEYDDIPFRSPPKIRVAKIASNPSIDSKDQRRKLKPCKTNSSKGEEQALWEDGRLPPALKSGERKMISISHMKTKEGLEDMRRQPATQRPTLGQRTSSKPKSLSSNAVQITRIAGKDYNNFKLKQKSRGGSKEIGLKDTAKTSHRNTNSSNQLFSLETSRQKSAPRRKSLAACQSCPNVADAGTSQPRHAHDSTDFGNCHDMLSDRPRDFSRAVTKYLAEVDRKSLKGKRSPSSVSILDYKLPSARIHFNTEQKSIPQPPLSSQRKFTWSLKEQNLLQHIFKTTMSTKEHPLKSEIFEAYTQRTRSPSKEQHSEPKKTFSLNRLSSQRNQRQLPKPGRASPRKSPPRNTKPSHATLDPSVESVKHKLHMAFCSVGKQELKGQKSERFTFKHSSRPKQRIF